MFKKKQGLKLKNKKVLKIKLIIYLLIIYISFACTYYSILKNNTSNNQKFIKYILKEGNINNIKEIKINSIVNSTVNYLFNVDFTNPISLLNLQTKKESNSSEENIIEKVSSYIEDPNKTESQEPIIYLYNSHQLESYDNKGLEIYGITPNVLMASYILKEKLNVKGISTLAEDVDLSNFLEVNNWDYSESYKASRIFLLEKISTYPSLKYFIDIHRDSVGKNESTTTIGGKEYAKVLFVIGLENPNYPQNEALATSLNNILNKYYPTISRGLYEKKGAGVDGVYNQDVNQGCILIELGGASNNINEVFNTLEAISFALEKYIGGEG